MKALIRVLKACGDPNRMRILKMLQHREMCVCELTEALGITQPSVSRHMKLLEDADLVLSRRDGFWVNYRINDAPSNPYTEALLEYLKNWLEDDPEIEALIKRASTMDREVICGRVPSRVAPTASKEAAT